MKTKLALLFILNFGVALAANADIYCERLVDSWICEESGAQNAVSFSWSTGSQTPFTFVSCYAGAGLQFVTLTITYSDGSTSTQFATIRCQGGFF